MTAATQAETGRTDPINPHARLWQAEQLGDLRRMREIGMNFVERLERRASGLLLEREERAFLDAGDICLGFARVTRAVRQIIVLEQEMLGLRAPPAARAVGCAPTVAPGSPPIESREDVPAKGAALSRQTEPAEADRERSDLNDLDDYDRGPMNAVIARIRSTLCMADATPPPDLLPRGEEEHEEANIQIPLSAREGSGEGATARFVSSGWETPNPIRLSTWLAAHEASEDELPPGPDPP